MPILPLKPYNIPATRKNNDLNKYNKEKKLNKKTV